MNGRSFLNVARAAVADPGEEWQRTAAGRTYFALFLECRDALEQWGLAATAIHQAHAAVRNRLLGTTHPDLKDLGGLLVEFHKARVQADYDLTTPPVSSFQVELDIDRAEDAVATLDEIDGDPARRAAVIAALHGFP